MDIDLRYTKLFGDHFYQLWVDGKVYDTFFAKWPLTWSEMSDIESYYREGLTLPSEDASM